MGVCWGFRRFLTHATWRSMEGLAAYGLTPPDLAVYGEVGGLWKTLGLVMICRGGGGFEDRRRPMLAVFIL